MEDNKNIQTCENCIFFDFVGNYWEPYPINFCKKFKKELGSECIEPNNCEEYILRLNLGV